MLIKYKKLYKDAKPFKYSREGDACLDMYADDDYIIMPFNVKIINTGIAIEIPEGYEGIVRGRSGLASQGIMCHLGTVDCTYRGDIGVVLFNTTTEPFHIHKGNRIGQFSIQPTIHINLIESDNLSETERGDSGYGSSGK